MNSESPVITEYHIAKEERYQDLSYKLFCINDVEDIIRTYPNRRVAAILGFLRNLIDGQTGTICLAAIKWLMRHDTPLFILDYNGTLLSSTLPREPVNGPLKIAQIDAYRDRAKRFYIAKKLVEAKAQRTLDVMKWLAARYGELSSQVQHGLTNELERLHQSGDLPRLLMSEGRIADIYWRPCNRFCRPGLDSGRGCMRRIR